MVGDLPDPRHAIIRTRIFQLYAEANPGLKCPWTGRTGSTLKRLLRANPSWTAAAFVTCIDNRFASDGINPAADPLDWLSSHRERLVNYAAGPLDKFGRPKPQVLTGFTKEWSAHVERQAVRELQALRAKGLVH